MAKYKFRLLLDYTTGTKEMYVANKADGTSGGFSDFYFIDTDSTVNYSSSQALDVIENMMGCTVYQNQSQFTGSIGSGVSNSASDKFVQNSATKPLSASLTGGTESGSIVLTANSNLKRYKFFGEKVCSVLGFPENIWIYPENAVISNTGSEESRIRGNLQSKALTVTNTFNISNIGSVTSDIPFRINKESDRWIKWVNVTSSANIDENNLLLGYNSDNDTYELKNNISAQDTVNFNISASKVRLTGNLDIGGVGNFITSTYGSTKITNEDDSFIELKSGNATYGVMIRDYNSNLYANISTNDGYLSLSYDTITANQGLFITEPSANVNRVGIGTNSPSKTLTVHGESFLSESIFTDGHLYFEDDFHMGYYGGGLNFAETSVSDYRLFIEEGGNIGIGTNTPGYKFDVVGDARIQGNGRPSIRFSTETDTPNLADTFAGTTDKAYISFDDNNSSNDPGFIMHETRNTSETNEGVLHLCPSDDNSVSDYVSIHGTNDADMIKLHTDGQISGVTTIATTTVNSTNVNSTNSSIDEMTSNIIRTAYVMTSGFESSSEFRAVANSDYSKFKLYGSTDLYAIGMYTAMTHGALNDWATTFTMNNDGDRGWVFRHSDMTQAQAAMSLTTTGTMCLKNRLSVGLEAMDSGDTNSTPAATTEIAGIGTVPLRLINNNNDQIWFQRDTNPSLTGAHTFVDNGDNSNDGTVYGWNFWMGNESGIGTVFNIQSSGEIYIPNNVAIGDESNPSAPLHIFQTSDDPGGALRMKNNDDSNYWDIYVNVNSDLRFAYNGSTSYGGYLNNTSNVGAINFTGQHRSLPSTGKSADYTASIGHIVTADGTYSNLYELTSSKQMTKPNINESLPNVRLSTKAYDKSVFGVISDSEDDTVSDGDNIRTFTQGIFTMTTAKENSDDNRLHINSLGEGAVWVSNYSGSLENGDYITTSPIEGLGMKQNDDLLHNYTVAKITQDCTFDLDATNYDCVEFQWSGSTYRKAFVGCTYHCG